MRDQISRRLINIVVRTSLVVVLGSLPVLCFAWASTRSAATRPSAPDMEDAEPRYVVGTFRDSLTIGRSRVRAASGKTDIYVARMSSGGHPTWLRSFSSVASGRHVAHDAGSSGLVIVGVFQGRMEFDRPGLELQTSKGDALFFMHLSPTGRVISTSMLAEAVEFSTPTISRKHSDNFAVHVDMTTNADALKNPDSQTTLTLTISRTGKVLESSTQIRQYSSTKHSGTAKGPWMLASMQAVCDICQTTNPMSGPECTSCRNAVCGQDSFCCTGWDSICMLDANVVCPGTRCVCGHGTCQTGAAMQPFCEPGTSRGNCARLIGGRDSYCYEESWDNICANDARFLCVSPSCP